MGLLDQLNSVVAEREDNYDNPLPNFLRIALYWSIWMEHVVTPLDIPFLMDLLKTTREKHDHKNDNLLDKVGYVASTYERMDEAMKDLGYASGIETFRYRNAPPHTAWDVVGFMYQVLMEYKEKHNVHRSGA